MTALELLVELTTLSTDARAKANALAIAARRRNGEVIPDSSTR